jgi:hypothetical protein
MLRRKAAATASSESAACAAGALQKVVARGDTAGAAPTGRDNDAIA